MYNTEILNAVISHADILCERGILTVIVRIELCYFSQVVYAYSGNIEPFIEKLLNITKSKNFSELNGKYIRVKTVNEKIVSIGNIVEEIWFSQLNMNET